MIFPMPNLRGDRPVWSFSYKNWHHEDHRYRVQIESIEYGRYEDSALFEWVLHAHVIERDGGLREGRRTFKLNGLRDIEVE